MPEIKLPITPSGHVTALDLLIKALYLDVLENDPERFQRLRNTISDWGASHDDQHGEELKNNPPEYRSVQKTANRMLDAVESRKQKNSRGDLA